DAGRAGRPPERRPHGRRGGRLCCRRRGDAGRAARRRRIAGWLDRLTRRLGDLNGQRRRGDGQWRLLRRCGLLRGHRGRRRRVGRGLGERDRRRRADAELGEQHVAQRRKLHRELDGRGRRGGREHDGRRWRGGGWRRPRRGGGGGAGGRRWRHGGRRRRGDGGAGGWRRGRGRRRRRRLQDDPLVLLRRAAVVGLGGVEGDGAFAGRRVGGELDLVAGVGVLEVGALVGDPRAQVDLEAAVAAGERADQHAGAARSLAVVVLDVGPDERAAGLAAAARVEHGALDGVGGRRAGGDRRGLHLVVLAGVVVGRAAGDDVEEVVGRRLEASDVDVVGRAGERLTARIVRL